ncbi:MAG: hypothetical protein VB032_00160 [Burkholderiaceae bacterium]|nr:hypothetical protein [Burkholderiaceae bacterium]
MGFSPGNQFEGIVSSSQDAMVNFGMDIGAALAALDYSQINAVPSKWGKRQMPIQRLPGSGFQPEASLA